MVCEAALGEDDGARVAAHVHADHGRWRGCARTSPSSHVPAPTPDTTPHAVAGAEQASVTACATPTLVALAVKALKTLELDCREAKPLVNRAAQALEERGVPGTLELLIRETLVMLPTPGVRS
jgi:hypothetical protein